MSIDAAAILAVAEAATKLRADQMPTEQAAIRAMHQAWLRLKELGWREGQYMPLTADRFAGIQCGSTGIHAYAGTRDEGPFTLPMYTVYDGDIWPTRVPPALFRPWRNTDVQMQLRPTFLGLVNEPDVTGVASNACPECGGAGEFESALHCETCTECNGTGKRAHGVSPSGAREDAPHTPMGGKDGS